MRVFNTENISMPLFYFSIYILLRFISLRKMHCHGNYYLCLSNGRLLYLLSSRISHHSSAILCIFHILTSLWNLEWLLKSCKAHRNKCYNDIKKKTNKKCRMCLTPLMNFWPLHYLSQRRMSLTPNHARIGFAFSILPRSQVQG